MCGTASAPEHPEFVFCSAPAVILVHCGVRSLQAERSGEGVRRRAPLFLRRAHCESLLSLCKRLVDFIISALTISYFFFKSPVRFVKRAGV